MKQIILNKCDDGTIWVTSDEDPIGTEACFDKITDERDQMLVALCDFLGYEPFYTLNLDSVAPLEEIEAEYEFVKKNYGKWLEKRLTAEQTNGGESK